MVERQIEKVKFKATCFCLIALCFIGEIFTTQNIGLAAYLMPGHRECVANLIETVREIQSDKYALKVEQPFTYDVDGEWKVHGNDIIGSIELVGSGSEVSGNIEVFHPENTAPPGQDSSGRFNFQAITQIGGNLAGSLRGNILRLKGEIVWQKAFKAGGVGKWQFEEISLPISMQGHLAKDEIRFNYHFEYPLLGKYTKGRFTAQKIPGSGEKYKKPEKGDWKKILKGIMKTN